MYNTLTRGRSGILFFIIDDLETDAGRAKFNGKTDFACAIFSITP